VAKLKVHYYQMLIALLRNNEFRFLISLFTGIIERFLQSTFSEKSIPDPVLKFNF
jgi:hypothetical protein